jgi:4-hydroxybenzoyl-CoA reductase subunit beta
MMRLPPFRYLKPNTAREAAKMLADHAREEAMAVSGGTDLYPNMKRRQFAPKVLVGLRALEGGREVATGSDESLEIGGLATLQSLERSALLQSRFPALAKAAGLVSSPTLRHMGTVGGNLCVDTRCTYYNQTYDWRKAIDFCMKKDGAICWVAPSSPRCWAVSSSDTAPLFIALDASVTLVGPSGERRIPVKDLYRLDGIDFVTKKREEILTAIHVPAPNGLRATYLKLRRRDSIDFPILGVAAALSTAKDGTVTKARIVLTAVESAPVEAEKAGALLVGKKLTDDLIEEASALAYRPAKPLDNTDLTNPYRKKMAKVYVARALREIRIAGKS